jgi:hypothetical protein
MVLTKRKLYLITPYFYDKNVTCPIKLKKKPPSLTLKHAKKTLMRIFLHILFYIFGIGNANVLIK